MLFSALLIVATVTAAPPPLTLTSPHTPYACFAATTCKERVVACFAQAVRGDRSVPEACARKPKTIPAKARPFKRKS
jgi:hypothetical protein